MLWDGVYVPNEQVVMEVSESGWKLLGEHCARHSFLAEHAKLAPGQIHMLLLPTPTGGVQDEFCCVVCVAEHEALEIHAGATMHWQLTPAFGTARIEEPESMSTNTSCGGVPSDTNMYGV